MTIRELKRKRTIKQNSAQWGVIYNQIEEFYNENPVNFIYDVARAMWLNFRVTKEIVHAICKHLFNSGMSTAKLSKDGHSKYFEKIQKHFIKKHEGYEIKPPVKRDGLEQFKPYYED